jgi:two-component system alkaline phosphatase synthesis response regulator PhoP
MGEERKKIMIVEDDIFISDIYQMKFNQEGFEVFLAKNGVDALQQLQNVLPDIILLDIMMPEMDGVETLKEIKKNEKLKNIPTIMLTNISEREKAQECFKYGLNDYLIKSNFTPSEVVVKINSLLEI